MDARVRQYACDPARSDADKRQGLPIWAWREWQEMATRLAAQEAALGVLEQVVGNVQAGLAELVRKLKDGGVLK